jgi:hypothetical protein
VRACVRGTHDDDGETTTTTSTEGSDDDVWSDALSDDDDDDDSLSFSLSLYLFKFTDRRITSSNIIYHMTTLRARKVVTLPTRHYSTAAFVCSYMCVCKCVRVCVCAVSIYPGIGVLQVSSSSSS